MKVVFHSDFHGTYTNDPASEEGRLEPSERILKTRYTFVEARPASSEQVRLVHGERHIATVERDTEVWRMALLAAGGALDAARLAAGGESSLALIRPPGHHASADSCWGFCYFNNVAIAVAALLVDPSVPVNSALILDIDLHFGDGTANIFRSRDEVAYVHPEGSTGQEWLDDCRDELDRAGDFDIIAVSAGFDRHADDWGQLLETEDYLTIGQWVRAISLERCSGRRFAVLEGGYNASSMAEAAAALASGMDGEIP